MRSATSALDPDVVIDGARVTRWLFLRTYGAPDGPTVYTHPLCPNAWRNGIKVGDEAPAH